MNLQNRVFMTDSYAYYDGLAGDNHVKKFAGRARVWADFLCFFGDF